MSELDPLIHQQTRLRIMAALLSLNEHEQMDFTFLRDLLELSDGNLSVHLQKLEEAGYVAVEKRFVKRQPKTVLCVTPEGREAFTVYVDLLEQIIHAKG